MSELSPVRFKNHGELLRLAAGRYKSQKGPPQAPSSFQSPYEGGKASAKPIWISLSNRGALTGPASGPSAVSQTSRDNSHRLQIGDERGESHQGSGP